MSVSAIATNGTVRGGGAYYLISRSLGPEFGGAIGIVFYIGCVFNTGMNAVGLIDCLIYNFGAKSGGWSQWLPDSFWWSYLWATIVLVICTGICLAGSGLFARASNGLLVILLAATFSIPFSALVLKPFTSERLGIEYTGPSLETLRSNLMPRLTKGAAGSQLHGRETWQDLFGILFPATGGIFAGASMSGDLKHPSKAIPKGTLYGLALTFVTYTLVILALAATVTRATFYNNLNVIQDVNISGGIILMGEFATSSFSVLMGVIGSAKLLQALARDDLVPGLSIFGQGTKGNDEPTYAIIITYAVTQLAMLSDINQIASFVTMTYLMTFLITNLACFLLKVGSAPNFRPSFHYFNWQTAALGATASGATMFFVDGVYASLCVGLLVALFLVIHYTTPPKSWGDVSQSLIFHQVRKYLLRLRQNHIKFWRPSVLLFVNDPRRSYKLIQFSNSLKKGALFILGHVIVSDDFAGAVPEARRQQATWTNYIDFSKIKAFVNIAISPAVEWGARNIALSAGLGGMRPNIVIMGFFNLNDLRKSQPLIDLPSPHSSRPNSAAGQSDNRKHHTKRSEQEVFSKLQSKLPTDINRAEGAIGPQSYVTLLEDLLLRLRINVAIAKGFSELELPAPKPTKFERALSWLHVKDIMDEENSKKYIDLWPIQMSAQITTDDNSRQKRSILTTNFDTYTLILQLGCILHTVPSYKRAFKLRVNVFVEYESDVEEERGRVQSLLTNLRIDAKVLVFWLASGSLKTYEVIVNGKDGDEATMRDINSTLEDEEWWQDVQAVRNGAESSDALNDMAELDEGAGPPSQASQETSTTANFEGLRKLMQKAHRQAAGASSALATEMRAQTSSLIPGLLEYHRSFGSESESSSDSDSESGESATTEFGIVGRGRGSDDRPKPRSMSLGTNPRPQAPRKHQFGGLLFPGPADRQPGHGQGHRASDTALPDGLETNSDTDDARRGTTFSRPAPLRQLSLPKFTASTVPPTKISTQDGPGPSIMFADTPTLAGRNEGSHSIYTHRPAAPSPSAPVPAGGFPAMQSVPLNFNDLPCRAQHLILNELIVAQSTETAVLFTTLPSPVEGTGESEADSVRYLSDLEVLCNGLPPVLLIHSNSMTVTTNL
ncbi:hypothetical protein EJ06DRAFT_552914 [Trichodelitschia bisporula]|uniref:Amino acid permease/ SLC12A domain-containing protein n=1 Tax=Trichodelitschia bisporula TaxID=703511 RepID=A0A6G1IBQ4_9PEZI|nr:hypothetical protein EJ06DRAFT_552914 [Trichodelitschia bisporula]